MNYTITLETLNAPAEFIFAVTQDGGNLDKLEAHMLDPECIEYRCPATDHVLRISIVGGAIVAKYISNGKRRET